MVSRGWRSAAGAALLWSLAFAVPVVAQGQEPFYQLQVEPDQRSRTINERFGEAVFTLTLSTEAEQNVPSQAGITIRYEIDDESPAPPAGWSSVRIDPETAEAAPGEEVEVTVRVTLTSNDVAQDQYRLRIRVTSEPQGGDPLTQQLFPALNQGDSETVEVTANRALSTSEAVTSFADQYKFWLLAGAGALFLVAILLVRKRKGLELMCDQPEQEVLPGRGASFPVHVVNSGPDEDRLYFSHSELPQGWVVLLPVETLELKGGETDTIWVTIKAPGTARPGERIRFEFFASSRTRPGQEAQIPLEATVADFFEPPVLEEPAYPQPPADEPSGPPPDIEVYEPEPLSAPKRRKK